MMWTAEDCQQLAKEQYGSQKLYHAIDQGCNKRLSIDLVLMLRWPAGVIFSNDAKSCYDRLDPITKRKQQPSAYMAGTVW
jgi:hypothetical protein